MYDVSDKRRGDETYFAQLWRAAKGEDPNTLAAFMHERKTRHSRTGSPNRRLAIPRAPVTLGFRSCWHSCSSGLRAQPRLLHAPVALRRSRRRMCRKLRCTSEISGRRVITWPVTRRGRTMSALVDNDCNALTRIQVARKRDKHQRVRRLEPSYCLGRRKGLQRREIEVLLHL